MLRASVRSASARALACSRWLRLSAFVAELPSVITAAANCIADHPGVERVRLQDELIAVDPFDGVSRARPFLKRGQGRVGDCRILRRIDGCPTQRLRSYDDRSVWRSSASVSSTRCEALYDGSTEC